MKVLALVELAAGADRVEAQRQLADELRGAWTLYAEGAIREAYTTEAPGRVAFIMEAQDRAAAEAALQRLPLVRDGLFRVQFVELRPFVNWSRLFAGN